ncbi:hypothetical protein ACIP2Z_38910 [Streptomyces iakyrus]|uniref:Secreted protein n=1 Tax=Streptomyces iakyrus TaxID=68219 RepID=A0ABW8FS23_9ACTN
MTKLLLLVAFGAAGAALLHTARPAPRPAPMARLQAEENQRFAELCRRTS